VSIRSPGEKEGQRSAAADLRHGPLASVRKGEATRMPKRRFPVRELTKAVP